jgi:hypothetical protein
MPAFEGLQQHHGSQANVTRRESMSDQQPKGGIFSQLFHKYVTALLPPLGFLKPELI